MFASVALSVVEPGNGVKLLLLGQRVILGLGYSIHHTVTSVGTHSHLPGWVELKEVCVRMCVCVHMRAWVLYAYDWTSSSQ